MILDANETADQWQDPSTSWQRGRRRGGGSADVRMRRIVDLGLNSLYQLAIYSCVASSPGHPAFSMLSNIENAGWPADEAIASVSRSKCTGA